MAKTAAALILGLSLCAAGTACGRKGPLVLPPGRGPNPVEALSAVPAGGAVVLRWLNPVKTVAGRPLGPLGAVEIWVFEKALPEAGQPAPPDLVERTARLVRRIAAPDFGALASPDRPAPGLMTFSFPLPAGERPARLAFTVRVFDRRGRASEFAPPAAVDLARDAAGVDRPAVDGVS